MRLNLITTQRDGHMLTKILKTTSGILGLLLLLPVTPVILLIMGLLEFSDMAK